MPRTPTPDAEPRAPARPRRARPLTLLVGIGGAAALAAITALAAGCGGGPPAARPAGPGVPVAVGEVTREAVPVLVAAIGAVEARSTVSVRPQVGGEVTALHFQAGDDVARGQLLASIDPRTYRANLDQAQAQLERDKVRAANARQDVARYAELVAKDYVTRQQYEQSVADAQALEATLAADQATVENARLDLERATIRAPIGGRTGQQLVYAGNLVKASDDRALVVIQQMEPIDVRFAVPQQFLGEIRARLADAPGGRPGGRGGPTAAGCAGGPALSGDSHLHRQRRRFGHRHHRAQGHLSQSRPGVVARPVRQRRPHPVHRRRRRGGAGVGGGDRPERRLRLRRQARPQRRVAAGDRRPHGGREGGHRPGLAPASGWSPTASSG